MATTQLVESKMTILLVVCALVAQVVLTPLDVPTRVLLRAQTLRQREQVLAQEKELFCARSSQALQTQTVTPPRSLARLHLFFFVMPYSFFALQ
jgi:hypothetical protein